MPSECCWELQQRLCTRPVYRTPQPLSRSYCQQGETSSSCPPDQDADLYWPALVYSPEYCILGLLSCTSTTEMVKVRAQPNVPAVGSSSLQQSTGEGRWIYISSHSNLVLDPLSLLHRKQTGDKEIKLSSLFAHWKNEYPWVSGLACMWKSLFFKPCGNWFGEGFCLLVCYFSN